VIVEEEDAHAHAIRVTRSATRWQGRRSHVSSAEVNTGAAGGPCGASRLRGLHQHPRRVVLRR
jgi:hypothetical protein